MCQEELSPDDEAPVFVSEGLDSDAFASDALVSEDLDSEDFGGVDFDSSDLDVSLELLVDAFDFL